MSGVHKFAKKYDPLGYEVVEGALGVDKEKKAQADALAEQDRLNAEADVANAAAADRLTTRQVGTRKQELQAAAGAAGAVRSGNEQDSLTGGKPRAKRKYASVDLLGD